MIKTNRNASGATPSRPIIPVSTPSSSSSKSALPSKKEPINSMLPNANEPALPSATKKPALSQPDIVAGVADTPPAPILIVDDEPYIADLIYHWVSSVWDYPAIIATDGDSAIVAMRERHPRLVLLDIQLPDLNGIDVLRAMRSADEFLPVVMVSAQENISVVVEALKSGAYDYLTKPIDTERLQVIIRNALATYEYHERVRALQAELNSRYDFSNILSCDPKMHTVFKLMKKASESDITVCILGESGTGKELVARGLHANGPRHNKPFQVINCAAIPEALLESELFGHERGSFTGASQRKIGKFEAANGGTLFLDEIGDMDILLQAKLLRAIQEREFERVGGTESIHVDVRIICATNTDLHDAMREKRFREDLFYRISAFPLMLPPLRERKGDILLLAEAFMKRFSAQQGKRVTSLSKAVMQSMLRYSWPGNIREIESVIERAVLLTDTDTITIAELPLSIQELSNPTNGVSDYSAVTEFFDPDKNNTVLPLDTIKRFVVQHALRANKGNITEAAQQLEISRSTMYRFLDIYNIKTENGVAILPNPNGDRVSPEATAPANPG